MQLKHLRKKETLPKHLQWSWGRLLVQHAQGPGESACQRINILQLPECCSACLGQKDMKHAFRNGLSLAGIRLDLHHPILAKEGARGTGKAVALGTS